MGLNRKKALFRALALVVTVGFLAVSGCRDSHRDKDTETVASHDNALAEVLLYDMYKQVHKVAALDSVLNNDTMDVWNLDVCLDSAILSDTLPIFPIDVVLYFGAQARECSDGRTRSGRLEATFSGKLKNKFTKITVKPVGYFVDDIRVKGEFVFENLGFTESGHRQYTCQVKDGSLSGDNVEVSWEAVNGWQWV